MSTSLDMQSLRSVCFVLFFRREGDERIPRTVFVGNIPINTKRKVRCVVGKTCELYVLVFQLEDVRCYRSGGHFFLCDLT